MIVLREGKIEYQFGPGWIASQYDRWPFYRNHVGKAFGGSRAIDVAAQEGGTLWLVEIKDYRFHAREKQLELVDEIAWKVRDSIVGIFAAACWPSQDAHSAHATQLLAAKKIRVVLHLEQPKTHSKLFPRPYDPANLQQKLKQRVQIVDAHPAMVEMATFTRMPWAARFV